MKSISDVLSPYDVVLVIGTTVFLYFPYIPGDIIREGTKVIQITNDPQEASRAATGTSVIGDVALAIRQLLELVRSRESNVEEAQTRRNHPKVEPSVPPKAEFVLQKLSEALPTNAIVFQEAPSSQPYFKLLHINEPKSYFSTASGGLGFAMPAGVGAALAEVARPVVCILGEGSAQYSIQSLWSAVRYGANVTFIVLNNEEYAILKSFGMLFQEKEVPGLDLTGIDFEGLAKGYGIDFRRILDPDQISATVRQAIGLHKPNLIEIPIDKSVQSLLG
jgi:benzoylformate decarboxylase